MSDRQFPVTVHEPDGSTHTTTIVQKRPTVGHGEVMIDRGGRRYVKRLSGLGVVELDLTTESSSPPSAAPIASPAPEVAEPTSGAPFPVAVHGNGLPETVRVTKHVNQRGEVIFVAADESGRTFLPRPHGVSGVVEIGAA